ncbi:MAG TPA: carboxymuconolactone decarboxylase family protein [Oxalicibacterium sp.]|uniref:carboxymuconolactone decarboxylase family protein n=1 Tax=Oxalicibacterium sp. TaxID=2766525 RepID=UPI002BC7B910|nr:carboxymuconolactone decarboxylase family protein [Oxalicibacterium sp.]HWU98143.1 carboxymuconolactone decarboxylase family protein [Oxalicibacterium sp.]
MLDWNNYRTELMGRVGEIAKITPDTIKGYQTLADAAVKGNRLDAKTVELISLAVAVTTRCDGCIAIHVPRALEQGATREEIADALSVAISMNAGAALVYSARTLDVIAATSTTAKA